MKHRILVVEDDPLHREPLGDWFEIEGFEEIFADALEAGFVSIAAEPLPAAVLLDVYLGTQHGLLLVQWARRQEYLAHLPLVAVIASASA